MNYNPHVVGIILRDLVHRVINLVNQNRLLFDIQTKPSYSGDGEDRFTDLDTKAQEIVVRGLAECFPGFGIICEEDGLRVNPDSDVYFTVDPIDGTNAFIRGQSNNVGCMISMVDNEKIVAVCIGDINTREVYYYRPDSQNVWRIKGQEFDWRENLAYLTINKLSRRNLNDGLTMYSQDREINLPPQCQKVTSIFKNCHTSRGSIGIIFSLLWKGECSAIMLGKHHNTPWDSTPCLGLSKKLGYTYLFYDKVSGHWDSAELLLKPNKDLFEVDKHILVIHSDMVSDLNYRIKN